MARLPEPGGDSGQWGQILNDYLGVAHNDDGTLKNNSASSATIQNDAITVAKIATTSAPTSGQTLTYNGTQLAWETPSGSGSVPDATGSTKGIIQLSGDLGGTASSPTVPGLAGKEPSIAAGSTAQYYRGDKTWQPLTKASVGLGNADNTADIDKPISSDTQTALDAKAALTHTHVATDVTSGTFASARIPQATSGAIGGIQLSGDLGGSATVPTVPGLSGKEPTIATGTTGQYYRGDKSWQTLDKTAVGLSNVDNTADSAKPVSTATQTALNGKANTTHTHSGADITSGTVAAAYLPVASESASGVVELATTSEVETGTDTTRVATPAGVKAAVDAAVAALPQPQVLFVDSLGDIPPGTPVDTLVVVRAA